MDFKPKSEQEIATENLLSKGEYSFEVANSKNETSKAGNPMIKLNVKIFNDDGSARYIFDYLMEKMAFKLRHFCSTTGMIQKYSNGNLSAEDCLGKCGKCKIDIQEGKNGFPPKNVIQDYIVKNSGEETPIQNPLKQNKAEDLEDDDIPF